MNELVSILVFLGSLALVLILAYVLIRFGLGNLQRSNSSTQMMILDRLPLGPKQNLFIVKIKEDIFLLGVTEEKVSLIERLEDYPLLPSSSEPFPRNFWQKWKNKQKEEEEKDEG